MKLRCSFGKVFFDTYKNIHFNEFWSQSERKCIFISREIFQNFIVVYFRHMCDLHVVNAKQHLFFELECAFQILRQNFKIESEASESIFGKSKTGVEVVGQNRAI